MFSLCRKICSWIESSVFVDFNLDRDSIVRTTFYQVFIKFSYALQVQKICLIKSESWTIKVDQKEVFHIGQKFWFCFFISISLVTCLTSHPVQSISSNKFFLINLNFLQIGQFLNSTTVPILIKQSVYFSLIFSISVRRIRHFQDNFRCIYSLPSSSLAIKSNILCGVLSSIGLNGVITPHCIHVQGSLLLEVSYGRPPSVLPD